MRRGGRCAEEASLTIVGNLAQLLKSQRNLVRARQNSRERGGGGGRSYRSAGLGGVREIDGQLAVGVDANNRCVGGSQLPCLDAVGW